MNIFYKDKKGKGFSLLELLLVLGVIAALIVGAFIVYPKVRNSQSIDAEAKNIATIRSGILALYASQATISGGLNNSIAIQAQIFPDNMLVKNGSAVSKVVNSFGGDVILVTGLWYGKTVATLQYNNVPTELCTKLITAVGSNMFLVTAGGYWALNENVGVPYSVANVSKACGQITDNNTVINFYFE